MSLEDQILGPRTLDGWQPPPRPDGAPMDGRYIRLELLTRDHAGALHDANGRDTDGRNWLYLPYGPFPDADAYRTWVESIAMKPDPYFWAVIDKGTGQPTGIASYLRIDPPAGSIEVGHIHFSPLLQRTPGATEAMYLMMTWAFGHGYRRYEWKCNALNRPSRDAALRLGLSYEGVFRQAGVVKGRNRDTAWYATIDSEWPRLKTAFEQWLASENFDAEGRQKTSLSDLTRPILVKTG